MGIRVITEPTDEPLTVEETKANRRIVDDASDADIAGFISAARKRAERFTERSIAEQTLEMSFDAFPTAEIELLRGPVQSIVSVKYVDEDGDEQELDADNFVLDNSDENSWWLLPAVDFEWPTTASYINALRVRYVAGYSPPGADPQVLKLPADLRAALLLIVGDLDENRENATDARIAEIPMNAHSWLFPYRLGLGV